MNIIEKKLLLQGFFHKKTTPVRPVERLLRTALYRRRLAYALASRWWIRNLITGKPPGFAVGLTGFDFRGKIRKPP